LGEKVGLKICDPLALLCAGVKMGEAAADMAAADMAGSGAQGNALGHHIVSVTYEREYCTAWLSVSDICSSFVQQTEELLLHGYGNCYQGHMRAHSGNIMFM
jgi:hypothetical protein